MKRALIVIFSLLIASFSFAAFPVANSVKGSATKNREQNEKGNLEKLIKMSVKDYENLTSTTMNFIGRLKFKIAKKRIEKQLKEPGKQTAGFNVVGFLLGFLLPPYGVIIAYIFSRDRNLRKWAWIGLGSVLVVGLLVLLGVMLANFK